MNTKPSAITNSYGAIVLADGTRFEATRGRRDEPQAQAVVRAVNRDHAFGQLLEALVEALPWIEAQLDDPVNKPNTVRACANRIRAAIKSAEPFNGLPFNPH